MARPAPDPEQVVAAYEQAMRGVSHRELAERYDVSHTTIGRWVKQAAGWWQDVERLDRQTEYGLHRQTLGRVHAAIEIAFAEGRLDVEAYAQWSLKLLDRHARLTGVDAPTRLAVEPGDRDERPAPPPAAVRAIEDMRKRATTTERMVIEGESA